MNETSDRQASGTTALAGGEQTRVEETPAQVALQASATGGGRHRMRSRIEATALPALLVVLFLTFSLLLPETFPTVDNIRGIAVTQSVLAMLALAVMLPLIVGDFDLSIGGNLTIGVVLVTGLSAMQGLPLWASIVITLIVCTSVGAVNGLLVHVVKVNAFIATLAVGLILSGAAVWYTKQEVIFQNIPPALLSFGEGSVLGVPYAVVLVAVLAVVLWWVIEQTPSGRFLHAVGSNREAARLSGVNVRRYGMAAFVSAGFVVGIAAITEAAVIGSGNPTIGDPLLLPTYAAVFLGATGIRVGSFNVLGTLVAVATIAIGIAGLELLGVPQYIEPMFNGVILIIAVIATRFLRSES